METPAWGFREEKEGEEEEEEEEKEAGRLALRVLSLVPALVVDSGSGTFLVFLVTFLLAQCFLLPSSGSRCSASWPVWTRRTISVAWTMLVLLLILHLALFLLFFVVVSPYSAQCLVRHWIHAFWYVAPSLEREVQRDLRVHGSSCGTCRDVLHSSFDRKHHRCHRSCRYFVLFVGRRP